MTPYGYKIENGCAVIEEDKAKKIRLLYKNYLSGMGLECAAVSAGIKILHSTVKRMLENKRYLGDSFYPAIIDKDSFDKAQEELLQRASRLGRLNKKTDVKPITVAKHFRLMPTTKYYDNPKQQAEHLYNLIESEAI